MACSIVSVQLMIILEGLCGCDVTGVIVANAVTSSALFTCQYLMLEMS